MEINISVAVLYNLRFSFIMSSNHPHFNHLPLIVPLSSLLTYYVKPIIATAVMSSDVKLLKFYKVY